MTRNLAIVGVVALCAAPISRASIWNEVGDAGLTPGTAQTAIGVGSLTDIFGSIVTIHDADFFRIRISNPATFSATTTIAPGTMVDTTLYLFRLDGTGIAKHDDIDSNIFLSTLPAGNALYSALAPGDYLLGIAGFAFAPFYTGPATLADLIFDVNDFTNVVGPQAGASGMPILGWADAGAYDSGTYHITLTGAEALPAPGAVALLGLAGFAGLRRRRA